MSSTIQTIDNSQDILDSREIIARIEELRAAWTDATDGDNPDDYALSEDDWSVGLGEDDAHEMVTLLALAKEGEDAAPDWTYGEALIRDSYFVEYAERLAEDIGAINREASWPLSYIDWERAAEALLQDYTSVDFDGVTYWVR